MSRILRQRTLTLAALIFAVGLIALVLPSGLGSFFRSAIAEGQRGERKGESLPAKQKSAAPATSVRATEQPAMKRLPGAAQSSSSHRSWLSDPRGATPTRSDWRKLLDRFSLFAGQTLNRPSVGGDVDATFNPSPTVAAPSANGKRLSSTSCAPLPPGAIAWYKGEGNADDALGNHSGTVQGNVTYVAGKVGQALSFSGALNEMVSVENFPITRQFTVEGWIKLNSLDDYYDVFDLPDFNTPSYYSVYGYGSDFGFVTTCFKGDGVNGCLPYENDGLNINDTTTFHHIAVTHDGNTVSMYLDGQYFPNTNGGNDFPRQTLQETLATINIGGLVGYSGAGVTVDELTIYNRGLSSSEIQAIYNADSAGKCGPTCASPPSQMVSWFPAEGNANDVQGGNNGTLQNGTTFAPGKVGQAFSFDGVDDYINTPLTLDYANGATYEMWVKTDSNLDRVLITDGGGATDFRGTGLFINPAQGQMWFFGSHETRGEPNFSVVAGPSINDNNWHHIAATWTGDTSTNGAKLYVDGVLVGSATALTTISNSTHPIHLGGHPTIDYGKFAGLIDEPTVYQRALSATEIQDIFNAGSAGKCRPAALTSLTLNPTGVNGGQTSTGTVTLVNPAPDGGAVVGLSSSDANVASVPSSITIPQGATSGTFTVSTSAVVVDTSVNINASYLGVTLGATLTVLDTAPPDTSITAGPGNGAFVQPGPVTFTWTGTDGGTPTNQLRFQYRVDGGALTPAVPDGTTTVTLNSLGEGGHTFEVRAYDARDNVDATPAVRSFTIDGTPPSISNVTVTNVTYNSALVGWTTDEATTGAAQYAVGAGAFLYSASDATSGTTHSVTLSLLGSNTQHRVRVAATDAAGNQATSAETDFTTAPLHDASVIDGDVAFSNPTPADNSSIMMSVHVRNNGDLATTATAVFFDQTPGAAPVEVGRQTVTVPAYSNGVTATSSSFTVREGPHTPFVQLIDIAPADDVTNNHTARKDLLVGAPANRFTLTLANPRTFPNNDATFIATVRNTGSSAQSLTSATVTGVPWVSLLSPLPADPLAPGAEVQLAFRMQTPAGEPGGPANNPVLLPATFSVTGGAAATLNFNFEIFNGPPVMLDITVTDAFTNQPLDGATVAVDGLPQTFRTGAGGKPVDGDGNPMLIGTIPGTQTVHAIAADHAPQSISTDGAGPVTLALDQRGGLEISEVQVTQLTPAEIAARGVNLNDPVNNTIFDFVIIYFNGGAIAVRNVELPSSPSAGTSVGGTAFVGGTPSQPGGYSVTYNFTYTSPTEHTERWIIIPGDIRILKQFWDVTVFVKNSTTATTFNNVTAALNVPSGLALPDLNGIAQPATRNLGTLAPHGLRQANWVVRGDLPGRYRLTGIAQADGIAPVNLVSNEIEVSQPRLAVTFDVPLYVLANVPFQIGINVRNDSTIVLQSVRVRIKTDRLVNCELLSAAEIDLGAIAVGQTKTATFTINPFINGVLFYAGIINAPAPVEQGVNVTPQPVTWTGAVSSDWFDSNNWSPHVVPPTGAPALIPTGAANSPNISGGNVVLSDLTIQPNRSLTLGGGDLTVNNTLTLNGDNLTTGAGTLIFGPNATVARASGQVLGNVRKQFNGATDFTFPVGTQNGYSPVRVFAVNGTGDFTVSATQSPLPGFASPNNALQRYWRLTNGGLTAARLAFQY
ncbi:MAG: hypothetical protein QOC99_4079, partial [Acidobacteriota bacterium]|nr:hypothetical protein [Acidobacteriota bacterium]